MVLPIMVTPILLLLYFLLAITLFFYSRSASKKVAVNHYVAPLFIWLILNLLLAVYLKGAGFLIIPVYCGLFLFGYYIVTQRSIQH
jgi:hypothetical protein